MFSIYSFICYSVLPFPPPASAALTTPPPSFCKYDRRLPVMVPCLCWWVSHYHVICMPFCFPFGAIWIKEKEFLLKFFTVIHIVSNVYFGHLIRMFGWAFLWLLNQLKISACTWLFVSVYCCFLASFSLVFYFFLSKWFVILGGFW